MNPGFGLGLRPPFYADAAAGNASVDWFELISENFMIPGGRPLEILDSVRKHYPVALHGVALNLGGTDPLDLEYLSGLKELIRRADPLWVSDHLCWTRQGEHQLHDLLPLPYTVDVVEHVARRIRAVQDRLGRRILVENVTSYLEFKHREMSEWEFVSEIAERADCSILLDVNNVFVSAHNHGFDPRQYVEAIPPSRVGQMHLAGHSASGPLLIDTHDHPVPESVWALYGHAVRRFGPVATMIERDDAIPPLPELVGELGRARAICKGALAA